MVYDYIFCGYGLSAMLVLHAMDSRGMLSGKSILILDDSKRQNKTWCFWEEGAGEFDDLLTKRWNKAVFKSGVEQEILRGKYGYKLLSPEALEKSVTTKVKLHSGAIFTTETVRNISDNGNLVEVETDFGKHIGKKVFNSVAPKVESSAEYPLLLQHFAGWIVETPKPCFDSDRATFMDFDIAQDGNTRFVYVLPFSESKALVEYTLFSRDKLLDEAYEAGIESYLISKKIEEYKIVGKESGVIPMTAFPFWKANTKNVLHIGTAGGWTKPSTGYTLMYAKKLAVKTLKYLGSDNADFSKFHRTDRFRWYDKIFVSVLFHENARGKEIFTALFRRASPELVLRFLREETTFWQEIRILASCPKRLFITHIIRQMFRGYR
ncbi:lycopene cyclase family protein [Flavobacterium sp.]|uniref:lycopene cyclase family protein n=1 Tax=Flavobacterium sp. TaxID=239 RepID=UPI0011F645D1|nr:lycopene cyclase family protein [Flavobacterium sp.]RZJ73691.1 MAG: lycopene cyclase [Flavobacterium sp.]